MKTVFYTIVILFAISNLHALTVTEFNEKVKKFEQAADYRQALSYIDSCQGKLKGVALFKLAEYYYWGRKEIPKDNILAKKYYKEAMEKLLPQAEAGDALAQYMVGVSISNTSRKRKKEFEWYSKSAAQGNTDAKVALAFCNLHGRGTKKNKKVALAILKDAVAAGNLTAKGCLASYYLCKRKDLNKGIKLAQEAADSGDAIGQYTLGMAYEKGRGVPKDLSKAIELYQKAADQGQKDAKLRLKWALKKAGKK